jgi:hypothetical protein
MIAVSQSPVLTKAVDSYDSCTYKTWQHVVKVAKVLKKNHPVLIEELTGVKRGNRTEFGEAVYKLLIEKIRYYVGEGGSRAQPGAIIERCAPLLRRTDFPIERIRDWLVKNVDLTPNSVERFTGATDRKRETKKFLVAYKEMSSGSEQQLNEAIKQLPNSVADAELLPKSRGRKPAAPASGEGDSPPKENEVAESASETTPSEAPKQATAPVDAPKVQVGSHERSAPKANGVAPEKVEIMFPTSTKTAFSEIATQVIDLLRNPKLGKMFKARHKSLVMSVISVLDSGLDRKA